MPGRQNAVPHPGRPSPVRHQECPAPGCRSLPGRGMLGDGPARPIPGGRHGKALCQRNQHDSGFYRDQHVPQALGSERDVLRPAGRGTYPSGLREASPKKALPGETLPMRILGIDFGDVHIGLALSDPLEFTAQPLGQYRLRGEAENRAYFGDLIRRHNVAEIVVGFPLRLDGSSGRRAEKTRSFAAWLDKAFALASIALLALFIWLAVSLYRPRAFTPEEVFVEVKRGMGTGAVARLLEGSGVIGSRPSFILCYRLFYYPRTIRAGEYALSSPLKAKDVLDLLVKGKVFLHAVTVPEGLTALEIAPLIFPFLADGEDGFMAAFRDGGVIGPLGRGAEKLEGYLVPAP